jgi:hypothetical protein
MLKRVLCGMWMDKISPETRVHGRLQTDGDQPILIDGKSCFEGRMFKLLTAERKG